MFSFVLSIKGVDLLYLVGLGVGESDITERAIAIMNKSELFLDSYTTTVSSEKLDHIKDITSRQITVLSRSDMEEKCGPIIEKAAKMDIAILVGGDPLIATTHKTLIIEARKAGVNTEIVHSSSIFSVAIGESGLDFYRFGPVCTIPRWSEHYKPVSFYETVRSNMERNLHSIMLLDYDNKEKRSISVQEALQVLIESEKAYKSGIFNQDTALLALCNAGMSTQIKVTGSIKALNATRNLNGLITLILPSKLSEIEKETLNVQMVKL